MQGKCFICRRTLELEKHHIYGGSRRKASEKYGAYVFICIDCHTRGKHAVHNDPTMKLKLQRFWQKKFEEVNSREQFIRIFGRSFIT